MQIQADTESFPIFPYPSDGKENNGGFDILKNPKDMDKILEFQNFPALRKYIDWLNFKTDKYRSYGCDGGWDEGVYFAYVEFSFRDSDLAKKKELYQKIFDDFEIDTRRRFLENGDSILRSVSPRMAGFCLRETGEFFGYKIALYVRAQNPDAADQLLGCFFGFLQECARANILKTNSANGF